MKHSNTINWKEIFQLKKYCSEFSWVLIIAIKGFMIPN
jgi:hypothetical protein